ncbi:MAG: diaminopimelate epimerase [Desulfobacula sp.]|uniref:diaminopimelate epimerase n=1 Tax=Desulfobacula sp. TaxID=2593537 RepID=UPI0025BEE150|nr:diaminopimelate epimerase [Desulfobacula sp.]MCD4720760.1 diaminopimelate epimerase [Desulfobacula sp.]
MQIPWFSNSKTGFIPSGRPFVKMHGLRNDFVIVDGRKEPYSPSAKEIIHICDRHEGIGADELLIVEPARSHGTYAFVRIINPDGREVEACGNATRCIGWLLLKECNQKKIQIETLGGMLTCVLAGEKQVSVEMGRIKTLWQDIPLSQEMDTLHLNIGTGPLNDPVGMNIGNPHAVFFVEDVDTIDLPKYGKTLQTHPLFPQEANIGVAQLINSQTLKLSVWERPGNMTTACGTGACVAVAAAHRRGLTDKKRMTVIMPAGSVVIELKSNNLAVMTGPIEVCYVGYLS